MKISADEEMDARQSADTLWDMATASRARGHYLLSEKLKTLADELHAWARELSRDDGQD